jgi:AraC-like DNA-binding protein
MKNRDSGPSDTAFTGLESNANCGSVQSRSGLHGLFGPAATPIDLNGTSLIHGPLFKSKVECKEPERWQVLFLSGTSRAEVSVRSRKGDFQERKIIKSEILVVPPKVAISVEVLCPGTAVVVRLAKAMAPAVELPTVLGLKEFDAANRLFFESTAYLGKICRGRSRVSPDLACSIARVFAILVIEFATQKHRAHKRVLVGRSAKILSIVDDYLKTHLTERVSMRELARIAGVSPRQFRRLFRIATELSPREYLWHRRAAYGKSLLSRGDHNVAEAAAAAGFSDQTHMNRHFRAIYGVPPSTFLPRRPIRDNK